VSKDRSTITNLLRLLRLPDAVQDAVAQERMSVGHARALLALPKPADQERWAQRIQDEAWSVREAERRIQEALRPSLSGISAAAQERDPHVVRVEEAVRRKVGTEVKLIVGRKGGGRLEFHYADQEDLERVLDLLGVEIH
jgi:ParB family chromosome partitioning protein